MGSWGDRGIYQAYPLGVRMPETSTVCWYSSILSATWSAESRMLQICCRLASLELLDADDEPCWTASAKTSLGSSSSGGSCHVVPSAEQSLRCCGCTMMVFLEFYVMWLTPGHSMMWDVGMRCHRRRINYIILNPSAWPNWHWFFRFYAQRPNLLLYRLVTKAQAP